MYLTLQEYGLPLDVCLMIEKINYKEQFKLIFEELIDKINDDEVYKSHEWYFIQMLSFLRGINYKTPKFNDRLTHYIFYEDLNNTNIINKNNHANVDNINYYHHLLYKDHMNIQLYQRKTYNIYHNYFNHT